MVLLAALPLAACAPTLDWRSVRLPETVLVAEMPCRPSRFQREMVVAGVRLALFMLSCEAGGVTYGVASADTGDAAWVEAVLDALAGGAAAALGVRDVHPTPFELAGATPFRGNVSARLHGMRPDGRPVDESLRVFGRGSRVFLVSAIGASLGGEATRPFEDGLRFDLENRDPGPR